MNRLMAIVPAGVNPRCRHFLRREAKDGQAGGETVPLPAAKFLILESSGEGVFLYRYDRHGEFAGDTWHESVAQAQDQARFELDVSPEGWEVIAAQVSDPVAYGRERCRASAG